MIDGGVFAHVWAWIEHVTGTNNEAGTYYGFWSGFGGSFLAPNPYILVTAFLVVRHHNCSQKGCWRLSRHITKDGHRLCHTHVRLPLSKLTLPEVHPDHV